MLIEFGDTSRKAELGDVVALNNQRQDVVQCQETGVLMLNIDADELKTGDLAFIKKLGLTISNPDTEKPVALGVDYKENSFGHAVNDYLTREEEEDDDDDSDFFTGAAIGALGAGLFGGGSSFGGFSGGGFGGFSGGGFSGGGASASF